MSLPEPAAAPEAPGADFLAEIRGQPRALRALLEHQRDYSRVAAVARNRGATTVRMVGHGSSDNATSYGVYAFGLQPVRIPSAIPAEEIWASSLDCARAVAEEHRLDHEGRVQPLLFKLIGIKSLLLP